VQNGLLVNTPPIGDIVTENTFSDFELHAQYKYPKNANSGIYLRDRYEIQIGDDFGKPANTNASGGVFGLIAPTENAAKPADEWQS
jgi:hypothetical protein